MPNFMKRTKKDNFYLEHVEDIGRFNSEVELGAQYTNKDAQLHEDDEKGQLLPGARGRCRKIQF